MIEQTIFPLEGIKNKNNILLVAAGVVLVILAIIIFIRLTREEDNFKENQIRI